MAAFEMDSDYSSDIEIEEDEELGFLLTSESSPYLFEPEYSEAELVEMEAQRRAQERATEVAEDDGDRTSGNWWCQCGNCIQMPTEDECFCCREWDLVAPQMHKLDLNSSFRELEVSGDMASSVERPFITEHEDFLPLLNRGVLETFFSFDKINWKKRPTPSGSDGNLSMKQYGLVAYRIVLEWGLKGEQLGRGNRRVLPSCVVAKIRTAYPSVTGEYSGFKEGQDFLRLFQ